MTRDEWNARCTLIDDGLYIGEIGVRTHGDWLKEIGVDTIVSIIASDQLAERDARFPVPAGFAHSTFQFDDHALVSPAIIDSILASFGRKTLLHCVSGANRSQMVAMCWLIRRGLDILEAQDAFMKTRGEAIAKVYRSVPRISKQMRENIRNWMASRNRKDGIMTAKEWIDKRLSFLTGYMTVAAAHQLYDLLRAEPKPMNGCEIGVAGGRSLITAALAARDGAGGRCVGIDAYDVEVACEFETNEDTLKWWREKATVAREHYQPTREIKILGLHANCELLVARSQDVAERFSNLSYLHVDGNHCRPAVKRDLDNYLPRVASGGIIRLDNVGWEGVEAEADRVRDVCDFVDGEADYEIWRKR